jgi:hypothetical protein
MREIRSSGSAEGVMGNCDPYSDSSEPWWFAQPSLLRRRSRRRHLISPSSNQPCSLLFPRGAARRTSLLDFRLGVFSLQLLLIQLCANRGGIVRCGCAVGIHVRTGRRRG